MGGQDRSKRTQTDEALRDERSETDRKLEERGAAIAEDADEVVQNARDRADAVLAKARAHADEKSLDGAARDVEREERGRADRVLAEERRVADAQLGDERAERARALVELLKHERELTDERLEAERGYADAAIESRDDFLGIVTHDLRALLNGMTLSAGELVAAPVEGEAKRHVHREARRIQRLSARMNLLIGDLLDVVSIEAGKLQVQPVPNEANGLIRETLETFESAAAARGVSLRGEATGPALLAEFDRERVLQVLANLVGNAIKFTPDGGEIAILAESMDDHVRFSVADTGIGVDPAKIASIFDRYVQGVAYDRRGLGIGLYISRCIVEAHGGRIWVTSEPGRGSVFYFTLPSRVR